MPVVGFSSSLWQTSVHISLPALPHLLLCAIRQNIPRENSSESITTATVPPYSGNIFCFSLEPQTYDRRENLVNNKDRDSKRINIFYKSTTFQQPEINKCAQQPVLLKILTFMPSFKLWLIFLYFNPHLKIDFRVNLQGPPKKPQNTGIFFSIKIVTILLFLSLFIFKCFSSCLIS